MYSDLFDQLGRGGGRSGAAAEPPEEPPLVALKAGRVNLARKDEEASGDGDGGGAYSCTADPARGEIRLVWKDATGQLEWQWYDRRRKSVADAFVVQNTAAHSLARVPLAESKAHAADRVYVWTSYALTGDRRDAANAFHRMYWMQDLDASGEEQVVQKINEYLQDPKRAAPEGSSAAAAAAAGGTAARTASGSGTGAAGSGTNQVDALSSILENLGMPQAGETTATTAASSSSASAGAAGSGSGGTNQLTLADLQGAMAGIQAGSSADASAGTSISPPGPPLNDVLTAQAIDQLLESEAVVQRLLPLLPEGQRTAGDLRENLLSPQMRNTVSALQQALLPDDAGDLSGYASVVANFQLEPEAGQTELARGNPLAAFLECVIASVEKEEAANQKDDDGGDNGDDNDKEEETKDETKDDNNAAEEDL